jgi:hypothetical protein
VAVDLYLKTTICFTSEEGAMEKLPSKIMEAMKADKRRVIFI